MEDMLGSVAELLSEGVVVLEPRERPHLVTCCNAAARRLLNLGPDIVGQSLDAAGAMGQRIVAAARSASDAGHAVRLRLAQEDGLLAGEVEARVSCLVGGAAIVLREVEPDEAERAAAAFEGKMACAARVCGRVGHDMNNFLTGILGYAELAGDYLAPDSQEYAHCMRVVESVDRASAFNADLLAMASREVVSPVAIDLSSHLPRLRATLVEAAGPGVTVEIGTPGEPLRISMDPARLDRVLRILASNAGRAMDGRGVVRVAVERRTVSSATLDGTARLDAGVYALIRVSDTGAGLEPGVRAHMFEPFFTTRVGVKAAGVGLGVAFGLVRQAGGAVTADGEPGAGAEFRIYLPELG